MSYHKTNMGRFASIVEPVADIDGYIPEEGDTPDSFRYLSPSALTAALAADYYYYGGQWKDVEDTDAWQQHVDRAVALTAEAEAAVAEWQSAGK